MPPTWADRAGRVGWECYPRTGKNSQGASPKAWNEFVKTWFSKSNTWVFTYLFRSSIKDQVEWLSQNIKQKYKEGNHEEKEETWRMRPRRWNVWRESNSTRNRTCEGELLQLTGKNPLIRMKSQTSNWQDWPVLSNISTLPCALLFKRHVVRVMG